MKQRKISDSFFQQLISGMLWPLLDAVHEDDTLCMELRGNAVNIYYRGGSLFCIKETSGEYLLTFDKKYCDERAEHLPEHPSPGKAVELIPHYKQAMDRWFHRHPKYEREFQQLILRENNSLSGTISKSTDYFVIDIEYAENGARFDIVALKWLSESVVRKNTRKPTLALIEVKYGDGALRGDAGIQKHLADMNQFLANKELLKDFCEDMSQVFRQKCELGLVEGLAEKQYQVSIRPEDVEVIFIFANHDPDSSILNEELTIAKAQKYPFPVKIAQSSMVGYGLYANQLRDLSDC